MSVPWTDLKIAFGVPCDDDDKVWSIQPGKLPEGWRLVETDASGARLVAIFRVDGIPTAADGKRVANIINAL